ncbi:MAG: alpha-E domain-containing protein [Sphingomonadaceae bacterium]
MLGRSASEIFWMFRLLERAENTARLVDVGFRLALTRGASAAQDEWRSVLVTIGQDQEYSTRHDDYSSQQVFNFILRDRTNPASVRNMIEQARSNARAARTSLSREVFEATNEGWMEINAVLARPVQESNLGEVLSAIRRQSTLVRGAMDGTLLRRENFRFARMGTFIERADNTARILDVKYYVLLPSSAWVGSSLDNVQWEMMLRSVSGERAYRWLNAGTMDPHGIAAFLILDDRFPRSLAFCYQELRTTLENLVREYGEKSEALAAIVGASERLQDMDIEQIIDHGLHEFLVGFIAENQQLANIIAANYRFTR